LGVDQLLLDSGAQQIIDQSVCLAFVRGVRIIPDRVGSISVPMLSWSGRTIVTFGRPR